MELRKDYILDRWVFLAEERKKRPRELKKEEKIEEIKECFFCPGKEHLTPPEIGRIEENGKWKIRWFPNKYPAVKEEGNAVIKTDNDFFTFSDAYGSHEVIVECPEHKKQLWDLSVEHLKKILYVYKERINSLLNKQNIKYVLIFKNHGREGGTSLLHSHTQAISLNKIPQLIIDETNATKKFSYCPYCRILNIEKNSYRRCFENNNFVAFTPYASRYNFEIWIFSKRHLTNLNEMSDEEFSDLALILKNILSKLKELNISYNYHFHYAPKQENLHFHIEITPRIAVWAGFEIGSNDIINSVTPEDAARFYRGEE